MEFFELINSCSHIMPAIEYPIYADFLSNAIICGNVGIDDKK